MNGLQRRELLELVFVPLKQRRRDVAIFVASALVRSLSALGVIVLLQQFLSGVLGGQEGLAHTIASATTPQVALSIVAGLLLLTFLALSGATYVNDVTREKLARTVEIWNIERLSAHLMRLPIAYFERHGTGDLVQAMRQDISQLRGYLSSMVGIVMEAVLAIGYLSAALWVSPELAFWVLIVLPFAAAPLIFLAQRTTRQSFALRHRNSALMDTVYQLLRGIRVIRIFKGESAEMNAIITRARAYFSAMLQIVRLQSLSRVLLESLSGLSIVIIVIIGGFKVLDGSLEWPSLLAFLIAVRSLQGPLNNVNARFLEMRRCSASVRRIMDLLAEPTVSLTPPEHAVRRREEILRYAFDWVSFDRNGIPALTDISFAISRGQSLGIVGPSGAGKSTLLALAARFYRPSSGRILLNGRSADAFPIDAYYDEVALVPQEPFLFDASIRENIRCGKPGATDEEVEHVARAARIHDEIEALEGGYDTVLGAGAHGLSVGQAQRLNIARALLKQPSLLLLDEATSSLDPVSDADITALLSGPIRTRQIQIIVAHRLATVRHADQILVLENGRCVGLGPHLTLMDSCPLYREMWHAQQRAVPRQAAS